MGRRLRIAKQLLSDKGVIFISIDDNEQAQLKLLCDEVFGANNLCGQFIWRKKSGGGQTDAFFVTEHEYILVYQASQNFVWLDPQKEKTISNYKYCDAKGQYNLIKLEKWGSSAHREDRPSMYFSIKDPNDNDYFPIAPDKKEGRWRVGKKKMEYLIQNSLIEWKNGIPYEKDYFVENAIERLYNLIIDDKDLDIVLGGYVNIHGDNEQVVLPPGNSSRTYIYDTNNDIDLIRINPSISAKIFKKSFLIDNNIRFPEGIPGQDLVFVLNSIFHAKKVLTLNNFIVYNRVLRFNELDKSISLNVTPKYLLGLIKAYNLTLNVCLDCNIKVDLIKLILISHLQFFNSQLSKKEVSSEELSDLFNSPIFNEFKNHDFFNIATEFKLIFNNIEKGIFYNSELISYIKTNIENNIFYKYEKVKNILNQYRYDNKILLKNLRIKDDENNYLKKENEQLNLELKNINSSKLLKFKNLF